MTAPHLVKPEMATLQMAGKQIGHKLERSKF